MAWLCLSLTLGQSVAGAPSDSIVVARVGDRTLSAGDVERRLARMSAPEIEHLGGTVADAPRQLIEQVLAPELAAELEAKARGLDRAPAVLDRSHDLLRRALDRALADEARATPVSDQAIAEYFEQNRARFEQPPRVRVWRILVETEAEAQKILDEASKARDTLKWSELARQHSIDKATHMRQGDLGFVRPDGSTDVPRVRVDAALYAAVQPLADGQLAPRPVAEAGKFAVVWRRGSLPARSRTLDQERQVIRALLERRRVEEARARLIRELREKHVRAERPELLELVPEGVLAAGIGTSAPASPSGASASAAPSSAPRPLPPGSEPPKPTERGLR